MFNIRYFKPYLLLLFEMDQHIAYLKSFCRICNEKAINVNAKSIKTVKAQANIFMRIYNIDVSNEDPTKFSKYMCNNCGIKIYRYKKAEDKHKKYLRRHPNVNKPFEHENTLPPSISENVMEHTGETCECSIQTDETATSDIEIAGKDSDNVILERSRKLVSMSNFVNM